MNKFPKRVWISPDSRAYTFERPTYINAKEYLSLTEHNFIQKTEKEKSDLITAFVNHVANFPVTDKDGLVAEAFTTKAKLLICELREIDEAARN